jgi:N-acetylmuramoyl-L-alanine amidase
MPRFNWCFPVLLFLLSPFILTAQGADKIYTVVIDAGHGGHDPGALGLKAREKNINLAIALKLGKLINSSMPEVKVIYTRNKYVFVELHRRAGLANESKADLFISIHCNANNNHQLKGAETYVMGLHKSTANLKIAKLENAAILLETDYQSTYNGFDPNSDESYIIFSLNQNSNLDKSTDFAAAIQTHMADRVTMKNRSVKQAGFLVLYKTTMPSVLVETGYLSNQDEEKYLMSDDGQEFIASAICKAFKEFAAIGKSTATERNATVPEPEKKPVPVVDHPAHDTTHPPVIKEKREAPEKTKTFEEPVPAGHDGKLSFRVQVAAETKQLPTNAPKFSRFKGVKMYRHGGMFKYTVGDETDLAAALKLLGEIREKGPKDAFIVIFRNDERIPQPEADRLMKK